MARTQAKLTILRGTGDSLKGVTVAAGSAETQTETMSVNIDATVLTKGEAVLMLDGIRHKLLASKWPLV